MKKCRFVVSLLLMLTTAVSVRVEARNADPRLVAPQPAALASVYRSAAHRTGSMAFSISNMGAFGSHAFTAVDCFTGEPLIACEYPVGSGANYLYGCSLWIGGVIGEDTLVSSGYDGWLVSGNEFHPDERPIIYRSTVDPSSPAYAGARAEQEYEAVYFDTCLYCLGVAPDYFDGHLYRPLSLEVTQRSYSWSYPHSEDFVLLDYTVKNIGDSTIHSLYLGMFVDCDVVAPGQSSVEGASDDITGFMPRETVAIGGCSAEVDLNLGWITDNDGELSRPTAERVRHITGLSLLGPTDGLQVGYNWWHNDQFVGVDYGPQTRAAFRYFGTGGTGIPAGDRNKYHLLSNGEQDFDQHRIMTISNDDSVWAPPPELVEPSLARGTDARFLLSVGPFELTPGSSAPFACAFVGGMNLHSKPKNLVNLPGDPNEYEKGLSFSDFIANGSFAQWVYDNPGVDTDGDGYAGDSVACGDSVIWVKGDGVPDWRAADVPAAPLLRTEYYDGGIRLRWNGMVCETKPDWFLRQVDFEGYRIYLSSSSDGTDFVNVASYDVEDYYRYEWSSELVDWRLTGHVFTSEEAVCLYAPNGCDDPGWHPDMCTRSTPFIMPEHPDSIFYFVPLGSNTHRFGLETPIMRRFPDAPRPSAAVLRSVPADSTEIYLTPEGYFKYYEYELCLDGLISGVMYRAAVTAFDHGSLAPGGAGLESPLWDNATAVTVTAAGCCQGQRGNVDCSADPEPNLADIASLVDFLFISGEPPCCLAAADVNGSGGGISTTADITIGDVSALVNYLYVAEDGLSECP